MQHRNIKKYMNLRRLLKGKRGVTLWAGPSLYNGKPLKVILRFDGNAKTNSMHTAYIVNDDHMTFNESRQCGNDDGNCGNCDLRGTYDASTERVFDRLCYINGNGLDMLYKSIERGNYPWLSDLSEEVGLHVQEAIDHLSPHDAPLRIGGWGDGAMVPWQVWAALGAHERQNMTNYTHQWRWLEVHQSGYNNQRDYIQSMSMASCHKPVDVWDADRLGWRKFITIPTREAIAEHLNVPHVRYVRPIVDFTIKRLKTGETRHPKNMLCAADKSIKTPLTCDVCPIGCDGKRTNRKTNADVWIHIHGSPAIMAAWRRSPHWGAWLKEFKASYEISGEPILRVLDTEVL
jgi:hypothetical protein